MGYDRLKIYSDDKSKHFSISDLEKIILEKTAVNVKLSFKNIEDHFPEFGIRVSTDNIKNENIIEYKVKVVHHDHAFKENDILEFTCKECNLQIKIQNSLLNIFFENQIIDHMKFLFLKLMQEIEIKFYHF